MRFSFFCGHPISGCANDECNASRLGRPRASAHTHVRHGGGQFINAVAVFCALIDGKLASLDRRIKLQPKLIFYVVDDSLTKRM